MTTNKRNGTLYTGHTDDLGARIWEHKCKAFKGFAAKHGCDQLVWFETHETRESAFKRERQIKEWNRAWKINEIIKLNLFWHDLYPILTTDMIYSEERRYVPPKTGRDKAHTRIAAEFSTT